MRSPFLNLLIHISDGVVIYEPFPRDAQGLSEFQDTVHRLREMERLGLVGRLFVQTRCGVCGYGDGARRSNGRRSTPAG